MYPIVFGDYFSIVMSFPCFRIITSVELHIDSEEHCAPSGHVSIPFPLFIRSDPFRSACALLRLLCPIFHTWTLDYYAVHLVIWFKLLKNGQRCSSLVLATFLLLLSQYHVCLETACWPGHAIFSPHNCSIWCFYLFDCLLWCILHLFVLYITAFSIISFISMPDV